MSGAIPDILGNVDTARFAALVVLGLSGGCATSETIRLDAAIPVTHTPAAEIPLEVVTHTVGLPRTLTVAGSHTKVHAVEESLGHAVATAVVPWASTHQSERTNGWQLVLDLWQASARQDGDQLEVRLGVRATLLGRSTHWYVGQGQMHCTQAGHVGAPVFYACMSEIGREVAGWLGQLQP